jgi:uncharacterized protein
MYYGKPKLAQKLDHNIGLCRRLCRLNHGFNLSTLTANLGILLVAHLLLGCVNYPPAASPSNSPAVAQLPVNSDPDPLLTAISLKQPQKLPLTLIATIGDKTFQIAVAQTPEQQQMGLMFRTSLPDDEGMLFPFDPPRPVGFWMKNTLIALDMLYIRNGSIKEIKANVPPCQKDPCPSYPSATEIDQVIEIRGGLAKELGIKAGDRVTLTPLKN